MAGFAGSGQRHYIALPCRGHVGIMSARAANVSKASLEIFGNKSRRMAIKDSAN
jgi:hypothetical protein